ncbi:MAG: hypothetical protein HOI95_23825 [Chromatiales bacterium]|jgi:hypothetical protein|nr:hypothetical protein [Chromatiales bacterium]
MSTPQTEILELDSQRCSALHSSGDHAALVDLFLEWIFAFAANPRCERSDGELVRIDQFAHTFLYYITLEDVLPTDGQFVRLIEHNGIIANIAAASAYRTTDAALSILVRKPTNVLKLLTLYNARCTTRIDRRMLFDTHPGWASHWYLAFYLSILSSLGSPNAYAHFKEHLAFTDPRLQGRSTQAHHAYFGGTYIDHEADRNIKRCINQSMQTHISTLPSIRNRPHPRKAVILSGSWMPGHAVYRCLYSFVEKLSDDFELSLISLGRPLTAVDHTLFKGSVSEFA